MTVAAAAGFASAVAFAASFSAGCCSLQTGVFFFL